MAIEALEARLAGQFGRRHGIVLGRAAGGLQVALQATAKRNPAARKVILPATLCVSPAAVTTLAGLEPVFCDVEARTGNLDPAALKPLLDDSVLCVIAAHLYGQPCRIGEIETLCRNAGVTLIEDAAQALGADNVTTHGEMSVISFGHTKILDAGGGGAVLTDDAEMAADLRALTADLPPEPAEMAAWAAAYRSTYYSLAENFKNNPQSAVMVGQLSLRHPEMYLYGLSGEMAQRIEAALPRLPREVAHRRAMAEIYAAELAGLNVIQMDRAPGGVPWRFSLLIPGGRRDEVAGALRAAGFDASPWYPVVARFFEAAPDWRERWPGAARLEEEIVNLWVDNSVNESRVRGACAVIRETLNRG